MYKCINSNCLPEADSLADLLAQARQGGFEYLELSGKAADLADGSFEQDGKPPSSGALEGGLAAVRSLTSRQCDLFTLAGLAGSARQVAARDDCSQLLARAARWQSGTLVVIGAHREHPPAQIHVGAYETCFHTLFEALADLAAEAETLAVPLAIENPAAGLLLSPLELRELIDQVNSPYFGVCLHVAHTARLGDPLDWLGILDRRVLAIRLEAARLTASSENNTTADLLAAAERMCPDIPVIYGP